MTKFIRDNAALLAGAIAHILITAILLYTSYELFKQENQLFHAQFEVRLKAIETEIRRIDTDGTHYSRMLNASLERAEKDQSEIKADVKVLLRTMTQLEEAVRNRK